MLQTAWAWPFRIRRQSVWSCLLVVLLLILCNATSEVEKVAAPVVAPAHPESSSKIEVVSSVGKAAAADVADPNDEHYLYNHDAAPVIDYHNISDQHPDFIFSANNGPRIVECYAPWCPHCQHFRDHYVQFAKQITAVARDQGATDLKVYAVSCTAHKEICQKLEVHGYPKIHLFPRGSINSTEAMYYQLHPFDVLQTLGVEIDSSIKIREPEPPTDAGHKHRMRGSRFFKKAAAAIDSVPKRTKQNIYNDAALSFDFAMRNGVFVTNEPLKNSTRDALHDWLTLLKRSMPPTWEIQGKLHDLLDHFDDVVQSESKLLEVVSRHPPPVKTWSTSCSKNVAGMGYTCGLWELFHIMTVGAAEWNLMILDDPTGELLLGMEDAAQTLRNYVANFFGCEECRMNFLHAFDNCAHDRCHRLHDNAQSREEWIQLPLWLFETHNSVNVRLMHEAADRENRSTTRADELAVRWPSHEDCPVCWKPDGSWDESTIYTFLRLEYWPEDSIAALYRKKHAEAQARLLGEEDEEDDDRMHLPAIPKSAVSLVPFFAVIGIGSAWYRKRLERKRSGWHKRVE